MSLIIFGKKGIRQVSAWGDLKKNVRRKACVVRRCEVVVTLRWEIRSGYRTTQPCRVPITTRAMTAPMMRRPMTDMKRLRFRHHRALSYLDSSTTRAVYLKSGFDRPSWLSLLSPLSNISSRGCGGSGRSAAIIQAKSGEQTWDERSLTGTYQMER